MFYSEKLEIRRPLLIATIDQLRDTRTLEKVQALTRYTLQQLFEVHPNHQYAVACEDKLFRTRVKELVLGTYYNSHEEMLENEKNPGAIQLFGYRHTPEEGVLYRPRIDGRADGLVSTHDENYAGKLVEEGALVFDALSALNISSAKSLVLEDLMLAPKTGVPPSTIYTPSVEM